MASWKKVALVSAGFGAGLALIAALVAGAVLWYLNRPKPPKPWDSKSIRATFAASTVTTSSQSVQLNFAYDLENNTELDYNVREDSSVQIVARMKDSGSLVKVSELDYTRGVTFNPTLIPAKRKGRFTFHIAYDYTDSYPAKDRNDLKKLNEFYDHRLKELDGFVLLDQVARYEIDLPSFWKDMKPK